jgi:hypothetical protein
VSADPRKADAMADAVETLIGLGYTDVTLGTVQAVVDAVFDSLPPLAPVAPAPAPAEGINQPPSTQPFAS